MTTLQNQLTNITENNSIYTAWTVKEERENYFVVRASSERFGENEIMAEMNTPQQVLDYARRMTKEEPKKLAPLEEQLNKHIARLEKMGFPTETPNFFGGDDYEQAFLTCKADVKPFLIMEAMRQGEEGEHALEVLNDMEKLNFTFEIIVSYGDGTEFNIIIGDTAIEASYKLKGFPSRKTIEKMIEDALDEFYEAL